LIQEYFHAIFAATPFLPHYAAAFAGDARR